MKTLLINHSAKFIANEKELATVLCKNIYYNNIPIVKELLQYIDNINILTIDNKTPLHNACQKNNVELIDILLKKGIDTSVYDIYKKILLPLFLRVILFYFLCLS